jgi:hypothetical protein
MKPIYQRLIASMFFIALSRSIFSDWEDFSWQRWFLIEKMEKVIKKNRL